MIERETARTRIDEINHEMELMWDALQTLMEIHGGRTAVSDLVVHEIVHLEAELKTEYMLLLAY
jgi:hypothetical protein